MEPRDGIRAVTEQKWVPQLGDAEELLDLLGQDGKGQHRPVLVPNERGLDRALDAGVGAVAIFGSATETFAQKNLGRSRAESVQMFAPVVRRAQEAGNDVEVDLDGTGRHEISTGVGFYDHMTAVDNLRYTAALIGIPSGERDKRIAEALERVGLNDVGQKRVGAFSRGMRQRLGLAEILMKNAEIAILDEPTSGLDSIAQALFLETLMQVRQEGGTAMILVTHDLRIARLIADRVLVMDAGWVVAEAVTDRLMTEPVHPVAKALVEAMI